MKRRAIGWANARRVRSGGHRAVGDWGTTRRGKGELGRRHLTTQTILERWGGVKGEL